MYYSVDIPLSHQLKTRESYSIVDFSVICPDLLRFTNQKFWYKQMKGKTARRLLLEKYRNLFENKTIVCIEYEGLNEDQEREMFQVSSPRYSSLDFPSYIPREYRWEWH